MLPQVRSLGICLDSMSATCRESGLGHTGVRVSVICGLDLLHADKGQPCESQSLFKPNARVSYHHQSIIYFTPPAEAGSHGKEKGLRFSAEVKYSIQNMYSNSRDGKHLRAPRGRVARRRGGVCAHACRRCARRQSRSPTWPGMPRCHTKRPSMHS